MFEYAINALESARDGGPPMRWRTVQSVGAKSRRCNETIDASVFQRWQADSTYRPPSLVEWAKRKNVDPARLQTSVRADDPRVTVLDQ
jgi:hypothetical protein